MLIHFVPPHTLKPPRPRSQRNYKPELDPVCRTPAHIEFVFFRWSRRCSCRWSRDIAHHRFPHARGNFDTKSALTLLRASAQIRAKRSCRSQAHSNVGQTKSRVGRVSKAASASSEAETSTPTSVGPLGKPYGLLTTATADTVW